MWKNVMTVAPYGQYATAAGSFIEGGVGTAYSFVNDLGQHNEVNLVIYVASTGPIVGAGDPYLQFNMVVPGEHPDKLNEVGRDLASPVVATTSPRLTLTGGNQYWNFDITQWSVGRTRVGYWVSTPLVGGSTARATMSMHVIGRGYQ